MTSGLAQRLKRCETERESWKYTEIQRIAPWLASAKPRRKKLARQTCETLETKNPALVFCGGQAQWRGVDAENALKNALSGDGQRGYVLRLSQEACQTLRKLDIIYIYQGDNEASAESETLDILIEKGGHLALMERHVGPKKGHVLRAPLAQTIEVRLTLEEGAELCHVKIVEAACGAPYVHMADMEAILKQDAKYDGFVLIFGGTLVRQAWRSRLVGQGARCAARGAMLLRGQARGDIAARTTHEAPNGISRQHVRAVLEDNAHGVYRGTIEVAKGANGTDGYQVCRALLLGQACEMDAKPELEIYADEVKCSHGCAIGDLDPQALFYLRSRGLEAQAARALLTQAFLDEAIEEIPESDLRQAVGEETKRWLNLTI